MAECHDHCDGFCHEVYAGLAREVGDEARELRRALDEWRAEAAELGEKLSKFRELAPLFRWPWLERGDHVEITRRFWTLLVETWPELAAGQAAGREL